PATTNIYTLSLHDALPIWPVKRQLRPVRRRDSMNPASPQQTPEQGEETKQPERPSAESHGAVAPPGAEPGDAPTVPLEEPVPQRSEEHTSELQSPCNLVCR